MKAIVAMLICLTFASCVTKPTITRVTDENRDTVKGLRFFQPRPYLIVGEKSVLVEGLKTEQKSKDGKSTIVSTEKMALPKTDMVASVKYLPDPNQEYAIEISDEAQITIVDGWKLEGINNIPDIANKPEDPERLKLLHQKQVLELITGMKGLEPGMYSVIYENGIITSIKYVNLIR